jgi:AraC-like DNA-binding protein
MVGNFVLDQLVGLAPAMRTISLPRGRHRLHIMPTTAGCEVQSSARYSWDGQRRGHKPFTLLQHTISGSGWLEWEKRRFRIQAGETMLLTIPHDHRYWVENAGRWEFFWISMSGQEALRVHRSVIAASGPVLKLSQPTIERLASCCLRILEDSANAPGALSALAYEALMALSDEFSRQANSSGKNTDAFGRALEQVRDNLGRRLSVSELAKISGYSRAHFTRKFAGAIGASPGRFTQNERLRRAIGLLVANPNLTIKQISGMSGFDDPNYFAKVFRKQYAMSPSAFRSRGMIA